MSVELHAIWSRDGPDSRYALESTDWLAFLATFRGVIYVNPHFRVYSWSKENHIQMATRRTTRPAPARRTSASVPAETKPVALTVKLDSKTYVRLCTLGATQRRTNQDLLKEAVHEYLDRVGA